MTRSLLRIALFVSVMLLSSAVPVSANAGISAMQMLYPGFWLVLPILIIVEGIVALRVLRKGVWNALKVSLLSNIASTIVGIPVTRLLVWALTPAALSFESKLPKNFSTSGIDAVWAHTSFLEKFAMSVIWPVGWAYAPESVVQFWQWFTLVILLIPFFFLSVWTEYGAARLLQGKKERVTVKRWAWIANSVSYILILAFSVDIWWFSWWWISLRFAGH